MSYEVAYTRDRFPRKTLRVSEKFEGNMKDSKGTPPFSSFLRETLRPSLKRTCGVSVCSPSRAYSLTDQSQCSIFISTGADMEVSHCEGV